MYLLFPLLILLLLLCIISLTILYKQSQHIKEREELLREALWQRRHLIPLLLEVIAREQGAQESRHELIDLRAKVSSEAFSLPEQIGLEKKISALIFDLFQKNEFKGSLKTDGLYISIQNELKNALETIRIALNDYNFELQKWKKYCRFPFLKIFEFSFKTRKVHPLELI